jgi:hypothetical protein
MFEQIRKAFSEVGFEFECHSFTSMWCFDNGHVSVELYLELTGGESPHVVGICWVGDQEYSLNGFLKNWLKDFGDVPGLLAQGKAPF